MPFAGYKDNPEAYCAAIEKQATGGTSRDNAYDGMRAINFNVGASDIRIHPEGTGQVIEGVTLLSPGIWVDSSVGTPLKYTEERLAAFVDNWHDNRLWSVHTGGMPRPITAWIGEIRNPRMEGGVMKGDLFFHLLTDESKNTFALVKAGIEGVIEPASFSIEHEGSEKYNPDGGYYEADSFLFYGGAIVDEGASGGTKIMESPNGMHVRMLSRFEKQDTMNTTEGDGTMVLDEETKKEIEALIQEALAAWTPPAPPGELAAGDAPAADAVPKEEVKKVAEDAAVTAVQDEVAPIKDDVEQLKNKVAELSKKPAATKTLSKPQEPEGDAVVLRAMAVNRGTITGAF